MSGGDDIITVVTDASLVRSRAGVGQNLTVRAIQRRSTLDTQAAAAAQQHQSKASSTWRRRRPSRARPLHANKRCHLPSTMMKNNTVAGLTWWMGSVPPPPNNYQCKNLEPKLIQTHVMSSHISKFSPIMSGPSSLMCLSL